MNNRFKTDFLCPSSSFLMGFGSVMNVEGDIYIYNTSDEPDLIALENDWRVVGQDIGDALEKAKLEFEPVAQK